MESNGYTFNWGDIVWQFFNLALIASFIFIIIQVFRTLKQRKYQTKQLESRLDQIEGKLDQLLKKDTE